MTGNKSVGAALDSLYKRVTAKRSDEFLMGAVVFTLMFALGYLTLIMPAIKETGTLLAGDGSAQYYPVLLAFRRTMLQFFDNIANGIFEFPMMDLATMFGTDSTGYISLYAPFLPYYILTVLVPETFVDEMLMGGIIIFMFLSGLSFMNMCRHFRANMIWSGLFAAFYVFCGNNISTTMWNPHFFVMTIAFPFIVTGIDKILHDGSGLTLTLAVAWSSLGSIAFLVYMLPFAGLYALVRLIYVKKEKLLINIPKYFGLGILSIAIGVMIAGIFSVSELLGLLGMNREFGGSGQSILSFFIPSDELLRSALYSTSIKADTSVSAAVIPLFLYTLISSKAKSEYRCYSLIWLVLLSLPAIAYGLNGFMYDLCRWGFIPAMYMCYIGAAQMPQIVRTEKRDAVFFTAGVSVYMLISVLDLPVVGAAFLAVCGIVNSIPRLRYPVDKILYSLYDRIFADEKNASGHGTHTVSVTVVLLFAAIMFGMTSYMLGLLPFAAGAMGFCLIVVIMAAKRNISASVLSVLFAAVFLVSDRLYANTVNFAIYIIYDMPIYNAMLANYSEPDMFNRFHNQKYEVINFVDLKAEREDSFITRFPQDSELLGYFDNIKVYNDARNNRGMRYGFPDDGGFTSVLNPRFSKLMYRCGQDTFSMCSTVYYEGFSGKEPMYSLFGINYMYGSLKNPVISGITPIKSIGKDLEYINMYHNDYAFPVGVTYDTLYSEAQFSSFSPAELPFAMMNGVYLEGYEGSASESAERISRDCSYNVTHNVTGSTVYGAEISENRIDISSDVSGCFLYLTMNDVSAPAAPDEYNIFSDLFLDDSRKVTLSVETGNWPWRRSITSYTFALGYTEDDVNAITFNSRFNFDADSLTLTAVPFEFFESAYRAQTEETLKNVVMQGNTVSGHIDVTGDKVLSTAILYTDGWKAYVDGEPAKIYPSNGVFLGVPLSEGSHDVKFVYETPLIAESAAVSGIGILAAAAWEIIYRLGKRKKKA